MKKTEKTLQEFLESIPALEKSELGVLRGGFGAVATNGASVNEINQNCGCGIENKGCWVNGNCGCGITSNNGITLNANCTCLTPYGRAVDPAIADYSLSLSFM